MTVRAVAVWAPLADRVELLVGADRVAMRPDDDGWWRARTALAHGADYAFSLDGGEPLPDPRSAWQPDGVNGRSRVVDHSTFGWTDAGWRPPRLADGVIYELHVGTFTPQGTFEAAVARLPDLVELGVTHLELMPVAEFSGDRGWGYDGVDLYAPHHAYGGPDGLKRLVDAAHRHGLAVLLDVVYNHFGPEGCHLPRFGPYLTDRYRTPWGDAVNLDDAGSDEVRRFVIDNACAWLRDYHLDGLRLDAVHAIFDGSALHLLEELAAAVHRLGDELDRELVVIAESDLNDPRLVREPERGGYGLDACWADDVHHALHVALTGERHGYYADFTAPDALPRALSQPFIYAGAHSPFRRRRHGRAPDGIGGGRFVASLQNHDQVGNRAAGDRLGALVSPGRLKAGAALLLTAPYLPLLFAGEEWGASTPFAYFTSHAATELGEAVRRGRRAEFAAFGSGQEVPDPQDPTTFAASRLDWSERTRRPHDQILAWYRALIALRRATPELRDGDREAVSVEHDSTEGWLTVRRGRLAVATNLGAGEVGLWIPGRVLLASDDTVVLSDGRLHLGPDATAVVEAPR